MIDNKVLDVPDEVCRECSQLWEGECRAYQMPHSQEEHRHRMGEAKITACWRYTYGKDNSP